MNVKKAFLSKQEVEKIHSSALEILGTIGVRIHSEKVRKLMEGAGAKVDHQTGIARFSSSLIDEALGLAPRRVVYGARNPKYDLILEPGGETYSRSVLGGEGYIDLETGKYRHVKISDVKDWAKLIDGLEHIGYYAGPYPADVPLDAGGDVQIMRLVVENTEKHIGAYCGGKLREMVELAAAVMGGEEELRKRPLFSVYTNSLSPLQFEEFATDVLLTLGKYGIPAELSSMAIAGGTAPVTLAGTVLTAHAEIIAGIVIAQTANPGAPIVYRPAVVALDMSTGLGLEGTLENALMAAAQAQLAREAVGIPSCVVALITDSVLADGQSMIERVFNTALPAMAGASILSGAGYVENVYTCDPAQLVIDNEILGMTYRALRGFEVNDKTLGFDVLTRVGPGGDFLTDEHTLEHFRGDYFTPRSFNRKPRDEWVSEGRKDLYENARDRAKTILREHEASPLDADIVKELDAITKRSQ